MSGMLEMLEIEPHRLVVEGDKTCKIQKERALCRSFFGKIAQNSVEYTLPQIRIKHKCSC